MFDSDIIHNSENRRRRYVNDIILLAACLLAAGIILLIIRCAQDTGGYIDIRIETGEARISDNTSGEEGLSVLTGSCIYPLNVEREVIIEQDNAINILRISDGHADMTEADCPDRICVHSKPISKIGESIICLPHGIIVTVIDAPTYSVNDADENDAVTW